MSKFCPKCGEVISDESEKCPKCGFELVNNSSQAKEAVVYASQKNINSINDASTSPSISNVTPENIKKKKIIGIVMCVVGLLLMLSAVKAITNSYYKYCLDNYDYYVSEYNSARREASNYNWGIIKDGYNSIASGYADMANDAKMTIWTTRIKASVYAGAGITLIVIGVKKIKKSKELEKIDSL